MNGAKLYRVLLSIGTGKVCSLSFERQRMEERPLFEAVGCLCGWRQELGTHEGKAAEVGMPTVRTESG